MSQGYHYSLKISGSTEVDFKRLTARNVVSEIDKTSKCLRGTGTPNEGYKETNGDVGMIEFGCEGLMVSTIVDMVGDYEAGNSYVQNWSISYSGTTLYSGSAFYVIDVDLNGSIPGEGIGRFNFRSDGVYNVG